MIRKLIAYCPACDTTKLFSIDYGQFKSKEITWTGRMKLLIYLFKHETYGGNIC